MIVSDRGNLQISLGVSSKLPYKMYSGMSPMGGLWCTPVLFSRDVRGLLGVDFQWYPPEGALQRNGFQW
jgi:hypothetical protein